MVQRKQRVPVVLDTNGFQVFVLVPIQLAWMDPKMEC